MRKCFYVCAGLAALLATASAKAAPTITSSAGLAIWYDVRDNTAGAINGVQQNIITPPPSAFTRGQSLFSNQKAATFSVDVSAGNQGGPGDAEILRVSPRLPTVQLPVVDPLGGAHITPLGKAGKVDHSGKDLFMYLTVGDRSTPAGTAEVIAALGLTKDIVRTTGSNPIQNITYTPNTALWSAAGTSSSVTADGTGFDIVTKAVRVPVLAGPSFDAVGGAIPTGVYRAATIHVTAGEWVKATPPALYTLKDSVNNLLVARVYNGAGNPPIEDPDFGYLTVPTGAPFGALITGSGLAGNLPEAGTTDGNTIGDTSTQPDAQIIVQMKFDFNNDGSVTASDTGFFQTAVAANTAGTIRQREIYLGDGTNDNVVTAGDIGQFQRYVQASLLNCPCP